MTENETPVKAKALDLFHAYSQNRLDDSGGVIVSGAFRDDGETCFEFTAVHSIRKLGCTADGLEFKAAGARLSCFVITTSHHSLREPLSGNGALRTPPGANEMCLFIDPGGVEVRISKTPVLHSDFLVPGPPRGRDFVFFFFNDPAVRERVLDFLLKTLIEEMSLTVSCSEQIIRCLRDLMHEHWKGLT